MPTVTLTLTANDAARIQAAAAGLGYAGPQAMVVALLSQAVHAWEQQNFAPNALGITAQ